MDVRQFEALSRRVAHLVGRRTLLHAALVAPLVTGASLINDGEAKRKRKKKLCKPPRIKCDKTCLAAGACCTNADCAKVIGQVCVANACECRGGQAVAGNECVVPCNPSCSECERCEVGVCVTVEDATPCTNGGTCKAGLCKPDRSFGCAPTQNACLSGADVSCPNSTTARAACFIDGEGDPVCGVGLCTDVTTDDACESEVGEGGFVLSCVLCAVAQKSRVCVKPVKQ
jgi:hypothetical protein